MRAIPSRQESTPTLHEIWHYGGVGHAVGREPGGGWGSRSRASLSHDERRRLSRRLRRGTGGDHDQDRHTSTAKRSVTGGNPMRVTYDPQADSILWTIGDPDVQSESWAEPAEGVIIDFDRDKNPISVEIQNASRRYPGTALGPINVDQLVTLAQLAAEYNLAEAHLRKLAIAGRLSAMKIGRNWVATRAALEDYLDSRKYNAKEVAAGVGPTLGSEERAR
ncbi:MAG: DUF2283 domain-containing protein [Chloroflexi bacterium]|nr:DUF2283 domain-containing protein [Chloroflexota bacterium]